MERDRKKAKSPKGRRAKKKRRWIKPAGIALAVTAALFLIAVNVAISMCDISALKNAAPHPTIIYDRKGHVASEISVSNKEAVDIKRVPTHLVQAVVAMEDQRFFRHSGIDYVGTLRALLYNLSAGKTVQGGSTITQQLAKNLFLWQGTGRVSRWVRKGIEAWYTVLIEATWPKRRILEVYANVVEFGDGVYGAQAAARAYFRKDASRLTAAESARLAAVLPSPKRYSVTSPGPYVRNRARWIERNIQRIGGPGYLDTLE